MRVLIVVSSLFFIFVFNFEVRGESNFTEKTGQERVEKSIKADGRMFSSWGVLSGYMYGELDSQEDYQNIPLLVSFGFDLKPVARKIGIDTKGILEFQIEPFIGATISPENDYEAGISFLFKYGFPLNNKLTPYLKVGTGPMFLGIDTKEQGSESNFVDSAAMGFSWFLKEDVSLDCEYRFRHVSNAGFDEPNKGIETNSVYVGFTYRFE